MNVDVVMTVVVVLLLAVVITAVVVVVVKALVCAGAVIGTFVEVLTADIRDNVLIIVSDVTVDLLMDALTDIIRDVRTNIGIGVLVDKNLNVFAGVMAAFEFAMPWPLEGFSH